MKTKICVITNCINCPHGNTKTERTPGAGYALDHYCTKTGKIWANYIEWKSEMPPDGQFPKWCPLPDNGSAKKPKDS